MGRNRCSLRKKRLLKFIPFTRPIDSTFFLTIALTASHHQHDHLTRSNSNRAEIENDFSFLLRCKKNVENEKIEFSMTRPNIDKTARNHFVEICVDLRS